MNNKPKKFKRIVLAILLVVVAVAVLIGAISEAAFFSRIHELPINSQIAFVLIFFTNLGAVGAYAILAFWVLRGQFATIPEESTSNSLAVCISTNCLLAVFLALGALNVLFTLYSSVTYLWTEGGVPGFLISKGWESTYTFFVYDTLRFCLFSFIAVWPVTFLKPQKPVLYSLAIMIAMIVLFQYWKHVDDWATLPHRALWAPWLVLIHVLSVPAMYQLHITIRARNNISFSSGSGDAEVA